LEKHILFFKLYCNNGLKNPVTCSS